MNLKIKGLLDWIRSHYDRVLAFIAIAALLGSFVSLFIQFGNEQQRMRKFEQWMTELRPEREFVDAVTNTAFVGVKQAIANPAQLATGEQRSSWFFVPESRFSCAECGHPVPVESEKCPFCNALVTPPEIETVDHDLDTIPSKWENEYGMNPNDPNDALEDMDGDGFTNLEEYQYGTNPKEALSHPPLIDWLIVDDIQGQRFGLQFQSRIRTRDGYRFGINYRLPNGDTKTDFVEIGGEVSGFVIEAYEEKFIDAPPPQLGSLDRSELMIRSPRGDKIILVKDQAVMHVELTAKLRMGRERPAHELQLSSDETFVFDGVTYRVIGIDGRSRSVIVQPQPNGKQYTITPEVRSVAIVAPVQGTEATPEPEPRSTEEAQDIVDEEVTDLFREMMR